MIAVFLTVVLAPLSQAVSRGLFAQDAVKIASGEKPLALCLPVDQSGLPPEQTGHCCDLCLSASVPVAAVAHVTGGANFHTDAGFLPAKAVNIRPYATGPPPARGPPEA